MDCVSEFPKMLLLQLTLITHDSHFIALLKSGLMIMVNFKIELAGYELLYLPRYLGSYLIC